MSYPNNPYEHEPTVPLGQNAPGFYSAPTSPQWGIAQPGAGQTNGPFPPLKPVKRPPGRRRILYIMGGIVLVLVIAGIAFAGPLRPVWQGKAAPAQSPATGHQPAAGNAAFTPGAYDSVDSRLFSNSSPWNVPIGSDVQLDPNSQAMVEQLSDCCHVPTLFRFGMPIYTSTASDPTYTVKDTGNDDAFENNQPIHIPATATPSPGSDHWLFIYDKTKNLIFEMWNTHKDDDTWVTETGNVYSPTGDGVLQVDGSEQEGNGASYFGGVITHADIERGFINHALAFAIKNSSDSWRYPMRASDGDDTDSDAVPMGARLQLDPSFDCNRLPADRTGEKIICQALETYGGYVRDSGGVTLSMYFEGEDLTDPDREPPDGSPGNAARQGGLYNQIGLRDGQDLSDIPWDKLHVLKAWNSFTPLSNPPSPIPTGTATPTASTSFHLPGVSGPGIGEEAGRRQYPGL